MRRRRRVHRKVAGERQHLRNPTPGCGVRPTSPAPAPAHSPSRTITGHMLVNGRLPGAIAFGVPGAGSNHITPLFISTPVSGSTHAAPHRGQQRRRHRHHGPGRVADGQMRGAAFRGPPARPPRRCGAGRHRRPSSPARTPRTTPASRLRAARRIPHGAEHPGQRGPGRQPIRELHRPPRPAPIPPPGRCAPRTGAGRVASTIPPSPAMSRTTAAATSPS